MGLSRGGVSAVAVPTEASLQDDAARLEAFKKASSMLLKKITSSKVTIEGQAPARVESGVEETEKPKKVQPEKTKPEKATPEKAKPAKAKPGNAKPEKAKPGNGKPENGKPEKAKPGNANPEKANPENAKPEKAKPENAKPEKDIPEKAKPEKIKPENTKLETTKPEKAKPQKAKPEKRSNMALTGNASKQKGVARQKKQQESTSTRSYPRPSVDSEGSEQQSGSRSSTDFGRSLMTEISITSRTPFSSANSSMRMHRVADALSVMTTDYSSSSASDEVYRRQAKKRVRKKGREKVVIRESAAASEVEEPATLKKKKSPKKGKGMEREKETEAKLDVTPAPSVVKTPAAVSSLTKTPKPSKKKGKELSEKVLQKLDEEKKRLAEEQLAREAEEERLKLVEERKMAVLKDKRDALESQWRVEQLEDTLACIAALKAAGFEACMKDKIRDEWGQYLVCDGLPIPSDVPQMNTYLHLWEKEIETVTAEEAVHRTNEVFTLLGDLQTLIDDPFDENERKQSDWKWVKSMFREHQRENLDFCAYRLIRNIDERLHRIDIPTAEYRLSEENFAMCLFVPVQLPTPSPNPRTPARPRVHMFWPEMKIEVLFPQSLDCSKLALRALYVRYDHLSDTSDTFTQNPLIGVLAEELLDRCVKLWYTIMRYKYDNRVIAEKQPEEVVQEDGSIVLVEPEPEPELGPGEMPPATPYQKLVPSASSYAFNVEDNLIDSAGVAFEIVAEEFIVNLRKYVILGGVFRLDLFRQPMQPQEMVSFEIFTTTLQLPCRIEEAPFSVVYKPPPVPEPGVRRQPEEIEEELLYQERELDKLIFVTLTLPSHVLWMDVPMICQWDDEGKNWSTKDVHDFKHIEEKGFVTFRTGKFGKFALAVYKYPNLPYQGWELKPEKDGTVTLQLTAAIISIEFHVKDHLICISQLQNAPSKALNGHLNIYYKLPRLIRIMRECGADFFPGFDTFFYVEGTCEKYWPMERNLYYCLAMVANTYQFTWSRWNVTSDFRAAVFQMRHYRFDKPKQLSYSTCLVTPFKTVLIDCTEVSPTFSEEPVEGMKYYADLYHLVKGTSNMATKSKISEAPLHMVNTLADLLMATRFMSFS